MTERIVYAIGDVHGEAEMLTALHERILADIAKENASALIVHLGDLVDRGPDSCGAVAAAMALAKAAPAGVEVASVKGNHEAMMLAACQPDADRETVSHWRLSGGEETIASYGGDPRSKGWAAAIDPDHLDWLDALPTWLVDAERKLVLVHAGVEPATFPECDETIRMWTRTRRFFESYAWPAPLAGWTVVHGHTPLDVPVPEVVGGRINVDTGAVFGGPLSAAVLAPGEAPRFLQIYKRQATPPPRTGDRSRR